MIVLHKKGDTRDIKIYRLVSLLYHRYALFTRTIQKNGKSSE